MQIFLTTFESISILFFLGLLGFLLISRKLIPEQIVEYLSPLVLEVALPALIFSKLVTNFDPYVEGAKLLFPVYWIAFTCVRFLFSYAASFISKKTFRREFFISIFFQNATFIPLVVLSSVFGENSSQLSDLFLFTMLYPALFFNTYFLFFKSNAYKFQWKILFHPMTMATLIAISIRALSVQSYIPKFVSTGISMVGNMTIPLLMVTLGGIVYIDFKEKGKIQIFENIKFVVMNNVFFPIFILLILWKLGIEYNLAFIILVQAAVPPLTTLPVVMSRVGGERSLVNQFLISSFAFSILSIPLILFMFEQLVKK